MDIKDVIFGLIGGLGLFLFGMGMLSDGIKEIAGKKLRKLLSTLTRHRVIAVLVGAFTTLLVQSSSATTVMTVGFVNAGLLTLKQALSVIMGANVGTTFTAWLISGLGMFKVTSYALPAVGLGFAMQLLAKKNKTRSIGGVLLGFGVMFIGVNFMADTFAPIQESEQIQQVLIRFGENPVFALLAGALLTVLLQSSSATIAIVQLLAFQGAFGTDWELVLRIAIPFILGDNIGTTITAQLAALRASRNSKRAAMGHTIFNLIGVAYVMPLVLLGLFDSLVIWVSPVELTKMGIMVHIAIAHSTFNVFNTLIFIPFVRFLEYLVVKIIPIVPAESELQPVVLEEHLLDTPILALEQVRREIVRMAETAQKAVYRSIEGLKSNDKGMLGSVRKIEDMVDEFQAEITSYLIALSRKHLSDEVSTELPVLLHMVNDLERVGDHAVNIVELAERKMDQNLQFSESAFDEVCRLQNLLKDMSDKIIHALQNYDFESARSALENENSLNKMQIEFRRNHVIRMTDCVCTAPSGLIFIDLVDNAEKIGDHYTNIAQATIGGLEWEGFEPKVIKKAKQ